MPEHHGPDLQEDRNLPKYDYISFMEKLRGDENEAGSGSTSRPSINGNSSRPGSRPTSKDTNHHGLPTRTGTNISIGSSNSDGTESRESRSGWANMSPRRNTGASNSRGSDSDSPVRRGIAMMNGH